MAISDYRGRTDIHSLGIVNNNAGNVRDLPVGTWMGQVGNNKGFVVFESMDWGVRAWLSNFYSSVKNHQTDTIEKYISRYAPPSENDTAGYIAYISSQTGIPSTAPIPLDRDSINSIMKAQFQKELGDTYAAYVTQDDIDSAWNLLDSKLSSFFSAAKIMATSYPITIFGASALLLIGAGLVTMTIVRLRNKK